MDYWSIWESQRRLIRIGDACPSAEESGEIKTLDATGLITCDHAIVGLIQASKVEVVGKQTRLVEKSPQLWNFKGDRPRWCAMIDSGLRCWSDV